jgi:glyoxylase-like metal-dependent hydrolase (beta-lactamase superfamily II)
VDGTSVLALGPDVTVAAVCDAVADHPRRLEDAFAGLEPGAWPGVRAGHPATVGADGRWRLPVHVFLVRAHGRTVLVDAGVGPAGTVAAEWLGVTGRLPAALAALRTSADAVEHVVFTHLHEDHVGWGADPRSGDLTFPRARHVVAEAEWDAEVRRGVRSHVAQGLGPAERLGRLETAGPGELAPGIQLVALPGHSPGHSGVVVHGDARDALLVGDAVNHPVQVRRPDVASGADSDPASAERTRRALLERAADDGCVLGSAHLPGAWWRVRSADDGPDWEPVAPATGAPEGADSEMEEAR